VGRRDGIGAVKASSQQYCALPGDTVFSTLGPVSNHGEGIDILAAR
jgi:hypothetical protein